MSAWAGWQLPLVGLGLVVVLLALLCCARPKREHSPWLQQFNDRNSHL